MEKVTNLKFSLQSFIPILVFLTIWVSTLVYLYLNEMNIWDYFEFIFLGVLGAIFANSTGAGGGVIFIPFFEHLALLDDQSRATSFAIQCFGMTAGAITWSLFFSKQNRLKEVYPKLNPTITICSVGSVIGIWIVYGLDISTPSELNHFFSIFSILLGICLFLSLNKKNNTSSLLTADYIILFVLSLIGGFITAWLSVGIGEILALYLIFRGMCVTWSVAVAVIVSAITVWSAIPYHLIEPNIYWNIVIFAGPGAVVGGIIARYLALAISPKKLKTLFSVWVFLIGIAHFL